MKHLQSTAAQGNCALLVEDSVQDQWLIRRALESLQRVVHLSSARTGDEAVQYLRGVGVYADRKQYPLPSLVLLDIKLSHRSGFDVLQWVRSDGGEMQRVPVVMLSSSEKLVDVRHAYDMGANGYVVKPFTAEGLRNAIDRICAYWLDENRSPAPLCAMG